MALNGSAGQNIGVLSKAFDNVAIPASAAFSIWGLIFSWELVFVVAQFFVADFDEILPTLTLWFCVTQLMQGSWVAIFIKTDADKAGRGGDVWLWASTALLLATPPAFLQVVAALAGTSGAAYWYSFGMQINAAWVLVAAGVSVSQAAVGYGLEGAPLSGVAIAVLVGTVCLELWITGFIGHNEFKSPLAFFPVATWALLWVFVHLKDLSAETNEHAKRILHLYGSSFIQLYKWAALVLAIAFIGCEVKLCTT